MKTTTAKRLKEIMNIRNIRQVDVIKMCQPFCERFNAKLQKSDLSQYVAGKVEPSQYKLTILGLALGVSEAWLMGYDVPMTREATPAKIDMSDDEKVLIALFRNIPDDKKELVLDMIQAALKKK